MPGGGRRTYSEQAKSRASSLFVAIACGLLTYALTQMAPSSTSLSPYSSGAGAAHTAFYNNAIRILRTTDDVEGELASSTSSSFFHSSSSEGPKRICLVTFEVAGPHLNGGVGTAFTNLAKVLSKQGHKVRDMQRS